MQVHFFIVRLGALLLLLMCNSLGNIMKYSAYNQKSIIQWSMGSSRQFTVKNRGDDILAFFGSDTDRPLEYVCANTTALCRMHISKSQPDPTKDEVVFTAQVNDVMLPVVSMSGLLQLCIGPSLMFRKRPLVQDSELSCHVWHKEDDPSPEGYKLYPNYEVQESAVLAVYTWYMTADNYQEMRKNDVTQVFVPLFKDTYKLPINAIVFTPYSRKVQCQFQTPSYQEPDQDLTKRQISDSEKLGPHTYKFTDYITSEKMNSGVYNVICLVQHERKVSKTLNITFISGPMIVVQGSDDYRVVFAPQDTSGSFIILIYTTTPITSFLLERSDGVSSSEQILSEQVSYSPYGIVAMYNITMPWLKDKMSGVYTASVTNKDKESVTKNIEILKAKALQILVSPTLQTVAEGARVSFECMVEGNLVEELNWTRDFESLDQSKYTVEIKSFKDGGTSGLRLTFLNPTLEDSGRYICTASNRFEKQTVHVELSVWPVGSPYLDSNQRLNTLTPNSQHREGANVLNISDDDLLKGWSKMDVMSTDTSGSSGSSTSAIVVGVITVLILLAVAVAVGVVVAMKYFKFDPMKWIRPKPTSDSEHPKTDAAVSLVKLVERQPMSRPEKTPTNNMEYHTLENDPDLLNLCNEPQQGISEGTGPIKSCTESVLELKEEEVQLDPLEVHLVDYVEEDNQMFALDKSEEEVDETVLLLVETGEKDSNKKKKKKKTSKTKDNTNTSVISGDEKKSSSTAENTSDKKERKPRKDVKSKQKQRDSERTPSTQEKRDRTPSIPGKTGKTSSTKKKKKKET